jgi:hypothetical protein
MDNLLYITCKAKLEVVVSEKLTEKVAGSLEFQP